MPPLGEILQQGFAAFADEKDSLLSLTPIYLFCGLSFPLWMPTNNLTLLVLLSGVLTVGIGDTAASFVGNKWGSHKWLGTEKSIEGTIACIFFQVCVIFGLTCCGTYFNSYIFWYFFIFEAVSFSISGYLYFARSHGQSLVIAEKHSGGHINIIDRRAHKSNGQSGSALINVCVFDDISAYCSSKFNSLVQLV